MFDLDALVQLQRDSYGRAAGNIARSWPLETAMDADELQSFLQERHYCVLATTSPGGRALARPVAFTVYGVSFWFATVKGPRLRNVQRMPWASVVIEEGDRGSHRAAVVDGPVTDFEVAPGEIIEAWATRHGSRAEWAAAWLELRPQLLFSYLGDRARS